MEYWGLVKYLMLVLLVLLQIHECNGCFVEERKGLLDIKTFLRSQPVDVGVDHLLPSWTAERESDCCGWERVTCNATTQHVMFLSLNNTKQFSEDIYYDWQAFEDYPIWLLNVSLFRPFEELRSLNLSYNAFSGWIENEGFERLSILRKLESLDLSYNKFNNSILSSLSAVTSLKSLSLSYNELEGPLRAQELAILQNVEASDLSSNSLYGVSSTTQDSIILSKLTKLKHLDLSGNMFYNTEILRFLGALPALKSLHLHDVWMMGYLSNQDLVTFSNLEILDLSENYLNGSIQDSISLSKLTKLKHLDLSGNRFNNTEILRFLGALPALKSLRLQYNWMEGHLSKQDLVTFSNLEILDLSDNDLNGSIQGLCQLNKLEELDLSSNSLQGILPPCLNNLTSLRMLDLSQNSFTGNISSSLISALTSLVLIDLSHNCFSGLFSFSSFANHTKLEMVQFIIDTDEFEVETEISSWVPLFQLKVLVLPNCKLNKLTGEIPKFLLNQAELRAIDLSHNNLKGSFPHWLLQNNPRLEFLSVWNNSFTGQFPLSLYPNISSIEWLDVSDNQIGGQLQENLWEMVPYIKYLNLSRNSFEGSIPAASICGLRGLETLDLSSNKFSGEVPKQLVVGCIKLRVLKLSNNNFHGKIFSEYFNLTELMILYLDNNHFTGTLSNVISRCSQLYILDIGNNYMSGEIQSGIDNMWSLYTVVMRNNSFKGLFPCELMPSFFLDLSHNSFSGFLPDCRNLQELEHVYLQGNKFKGSILKVFLNSSPLSTLDIRDNSLSGSIPDFIGGISHLRILMLSGNREWLDSTPVVSIERDKLDGSFPKFFLWIYTSLLQ